MQSHLWTSFDLKKRELLAKEARAMVSPFDLLEINAEEDNSIDTIRNLFQFLSRKPTQGEMNLGLIVEAQLLSSEAQAALLKTLEEPPPASTLILIAPSPDHVLPTIVSRCELREETGEEVTAEIDWDQVIKILLAKDSLRLNLAEGLDIEAWLNSWQGILQAKISKPEGSEMLNKLSLEEIRDYLKALLRGALMQEDHVNAKLLAYNLVLLAPNVHS